MPELTEPPVDLRAGPGLTGDFSGTEVFRIDGSHPADLRLADR